MKAYNETWVQNRSHISTLEGWLKKKNIDKTAFENARLSLSDDFYSPNWLIRLGLFLFTNFAIATTSGTLLLLFGFDANTTVMGVVFILFSAITFVLLTYFIKTKNLYHSGIDNAFLYASLFFLIVGVFILIGDTIPTYLYPLISLLFFVPAIIRYADPLVSTAAFCCFFAFVFLFLATFSWGKSLLPFFIMGLSALVYFAGKAKLNAAYYTGVQDIILFLALISFYLGGNYFVVREVNAALSNQVASTEIPFAALFWTFTFLIPVLLVLNGIKTKERKSLVVGLVALATSIVTVRFYYSVLPTEWALVLGGIILIAFSVIVKLYLKTPKFGLSSATEASDKLQKLESILVSQAFQTKSNGDDLKLGGGDFGGGGSGQSY